MNQKTYNIASASLLIALMLVIVFQSKYCNKECPEATVIKQWTETKSPVNPAAQISITRPVAKKVIAGKNVIAHAGGEAAAGSGVVSGAPAPSIFIENDCDSMRVYLDSVFKPDTLLMILEEQVQGNLIQERKITFYHLAPETVKYIERTVPVKERIRLYGGLFGGVSRPYNGEKGGWSFGPSLMLTEPHGLAMAYGFDARNNGHQLNLMYKIKLRK